MKKTLFLSMLAVAAFVSPALAQVKYCYWEAENCHRIAATLTEESCLEDYGRIVDDCDNPGFTLIKCFYGPENCWDKTEEECTETKGTVVQSCDDPGVTFQYCDYGPITEDGGGCYLTQDPEQCEEDFGELVETCPEEHIPTSSSSKINVSSSSVSGDVKYCYWAADNCPKITGTLTETKCNDDSGYIVEDCANPGFTFIKCFYRPGECYDKTAEECADTDGIVVESCEDPGVTLQYCDYGPITNDGGGCYLTHDPEQCEEDYGEVVETCPEEHIPPSSSSKITVSSSSVNIVSSSSTVITGSSSSVNTGNSSSSATTGGSSSSGSASSSWAYCIKDGQCYGGPYTYNECIAINGVPSNSCPSPIILPQLAHSNSLNAMQNAVNLQVTNNAAIQIFDLKGNVVRTLKLAHGNYIIPLSDLPHGLYIVKASNASWKQTVKVAVR